MTGTPVRVARDASRSRAYWELCRALGASEAARLWPDALADLQAMQPELSTLTEVEVLRERGEAAYRESAREHARIRLRSSGRGRRRALTMMAFGAVQLALAPFVHMTLYLTVTGLLTLVPGAFLFASRWRKEEIRVGEGGLAVLSGGRVVDEIPKDEIAYVEVRSVHDEQLVHEIGLGLRFAMRDKGFAASWVCVYTKGGDLVPLGRPIDEAAAISLCASIEDELGLLPDPVLRLPRARVAIDDEVAAIPEVAAPPRRSAPEAEETAT